MADGLKKIGRKLLIASIGVATVNYAACGRRSLSNDKDAAVDGAVADGGTDASDATTDEPVDGQDGQDGDGPDADASPDRQFVGNLIP